MKLFFDVLLAGVAVMTLGYATVRADVRSSGEQIWIENPFYIACHEYNLQDADTQHTLDVLTEVALSRGTDADRFVFNRGGRDETLGLRCERTLRILLGINALDLSDRGLTTIQPLGGMLNLNALVLDDNDIRDLAPLKPLNRLTYLSLARNLVADVAPLRHLDNLQFLVLSENRLTRVASLSSVTSLLRLDITGNDVTDFVALQRAHPGLRIVGLRRSH
jgi:hypothetical protein